MSRNEGVDGQTSTPNRVDVRGAERRRGGWLHNGRPPASGSFSWGDYGLASSDKTTESPVRSERQAGFSEGHAQTYRRELARRRVPTRQRTR